MDDPERSEGQFQHIAGAHHLLAQIKTYHWLTADHAVHKALDHLHDRLSELVDTFIETRLGLYGRPDGSDAARSIRPLDMSASRDSVLEFLRVSARDVIPADADRDHVVLINLLQDMAREIMQCVYVCEMK